MTEETHPPDLKQYEKPLVGNFSEILRTIMFSEIKTMDPDKEPKRFWIAQKRTTALRLHLQAAYDAQFPVKEGRERDLLEPWEIALAAHWLIFKQGKSIAAVCSMSKRALRLKAKRIRGKWEPSNLMERKGYHGNKR